MYKNNENLNNKNDLVHISNYDELDYVINKLNNSNRECRIVTGGVGDFIALDYIYNFSSKYDLIIITTHSLTIKKILQSYFNNNYYAVYFNFKSYGKCGFDTKDELLSSIPKISSIKNINFINISDIFPKLLIEIKSINLKNKSKYLNYPIFDNDKSSLIDKFNLPKNIAFINPVTNNTKINCVRCNMLHANCSKCELTRNFKKKDYLSTVEILKNKNLIGVIISPESIDIPDMFKEYFINLSTKLDIIESIEILKKSNFYIGVDSCFSVFATKIIKDKNIIIKSNNKHLYNFEQIYYFPSNKKQIKNFI